MGRGRDSARGGPTPVDAVGSPAELRSSVLHQVASLRRTVADLTEQLAASHDENHVLRSEREQLRGQVVMSQLQAMGGTDTTVQTQVNDEVERLTRSLEARCTQLEDTLARQTARADHARAEAALLEEQVVCLQSTVAVLLGQSQD